MPVGARVKHVTSYIKFKTAPIAKGLLPILVFGIILLSYLTEVLNLVAGYFIVTVK